MTGIRLVRLREQSYAIWRRQNSFPIKACGSGQNTKNFFHLVPSFGNMVYNRIIACFPEEIRREGTGNQAA